MRHLRYSSAEFGLTAGRPVSIITCFIYLLYVLGYFGNAFTFSARCLNYCIDLSYSDH